MNEIEFRNRMDQLEAASGGDEDIFGDLVDIEMEKDPQFKKAYDRDEAQRERWLHSLTEEETQRLLAATKIESNWEKEWKRKRGLN